MEMETQGIIQRIRTDKKAISLGYGEWYQSFKEINELNKGDKVYIIFDEKKVDDKIFKNIKKITKIELITPKQIIAKEGLKEIPYQVKDTILLSVKDIIVTELDRGHGKDRYFTQKELSDLILKLTKDFTVAYKLIK